MVPDKNPSLITLQVYASRCSS
jgi:hypothetical protein